MYASTHAQVDAPSAWEDPSRHISIPGRQLPWLTVAADGTANHYS